MKGISETEDAIAEELKTLWQDHLRRGRGWQIDLADMRPIIRKHIDQLINTPHTADFLEAVSLEAAHQIKRWGIEHDQGKNPEDYFWLLGYLGGKCLRACLDLQREIDESGKPFDATLDKALHHTISTAAVCLNWHRRIAGEDVLFQPGIDDPERNSQS